MPRHNNPQLKSEESFPMAYKAETALAETLQAEKIQDLSFIKSY